MLCPFLEPRRNVTVRWSGAADAVRVHAAPGRSPRDGGRSTRGMSLSVQVGLRTPRDASLQNLAVVLLQALHPAVSLSARLNAFGGGDGGG